MMTVIPKIVKNSADVDTYGGFLVYSGQCKKHVVKIRSKMLTFAI